MNLSQKIKGAELRTYAFSYNLPVVFPLSESYYNFTGERFMNLIKEFLAEYRLIEKIENRGRRVKFQNQEERRKEYQRNYQRMLREKRERVNNGVGIKGT